MKRSRHISRLDRIQKTDQIFRGRVFMMMAAIAGIGLILKAPFFQALLWEHESEGVAMGVAVEASQKTATPTPS